jgi:tripartite-type tricarboxylate transporter receptor subunit TctC
MMSGKAARDFCDSRFLTSRVDMLNLHGFISMLFGGASVLVMSAASGQTYPGKPVRIVTSAAGTSGDIATRLIAQAMAGPLGQPVIVDNRPSGDIVGQQVAHAPPDGHTLAYDGSGLWLRPLLRKTAYDPIRDLQAIVHAVRQPALLVVHPSLPVKSVKDLISLAASHPRVLNYATGSTGSLTHLAAELFQSMAGVRLVRVAYKSGAQGALDLMAGEVQLMFGVMALISPHVRSGRLRSLGVTSAQPTQLAPGVPTLASTGLPGFEAVSNGGIFAPANTPRAIVDRLNQEIARALFRPEVRDTLLADGAETVGGSPEQFESAVKAEMAAMGKLIRERGIRED